MPAVKTNLKVSAISYIILFVKNSQKAVEFYRDTLGATVKSDEEGWTELDMGNTTLALHAETKEAPVKAIGSGSASVVFYTEKLDETHETLKSAGVKIKTAPHMVCETPTHIGRCIDFEDLDGNSLSFFSMEPRK
ncbi:MAG TPA: VOC family protein [Planktothrix sp.]|jgi:lactoylglutathione lyase